MTEKKAIKYNKTNIDEKKIKNYQIEYNLATKIN